MTPDFGSRKAILDIVVVVPIMPNAFICHFNLQPIYNELEGRSPQKMNKLHYMRIGRGATTAVSLGYTFPALIALKLGGQGYGLTSRERLLSWSMLCLAILVSVVGVISNIYSLQIESE
ncbi:hypothetical protein L1987_45122 [Smallanthus sonchifolius]|uniref:Uncharacterized protein n=1 Tax=Smallanthus sonchifolius TaxID=185202 RepID=A0ACB9GSJ3_9ASTR|nr:hypothetical protein L1987_45122 [Smallanthus sonchifolius]